MTTNNLTEQWKKGELESGWYYVNYYSIDGTVMQEYLPQHNGFGYDEKNLVQEVLAPVPSYEEYLALQSDSLAKNEGEEINAELENRMNLERQLYKYVLEENDKLKSLLKECVGELAEFNNSYYPKTQALITKIDEALK